MILRNCREGECNEFNNMVDLNYLLFSKMEYLLCTGTGTYWFYQAEIGRLEVDHVARFPGESVVIKKGIGSPFLVTVCNMRVWDV